MYKKNDPCYWPMSNNATVMLNEGCREDHQPLKWIFIGVF